MENGGNGVVAAGLMISGTGVKVHVSDRIRHSQAYRKGRMKERIIHQELTITIECVKPVVIVVEVVFLCWFWWLNVVVIPPLTSSLLLHVPNL